MIVALPACGSSEQNKPYGERWTKTRTAQRRHLAALHPSDRAAALLERYPDLRLLPGCDWERLSVATVFGLLFGAASDHFANVQLAALAAIVSTTGVSRAYLVDADRYVRIMLNLLQERFGIKTPQEITVDMWETWGRDTALMRRLTQPNAAKRRRRRRVPGAGGRTPHSSYDALQRFDKKELVRRIRSVETELDAERQKRSALAYDQQVLLARMIRLETEIVLLQAEESQ